MEGSAISGKNVNEMFESVIRKYIENNGDIGGGGGGGGSGGISKGGDKSSKDTVKLDKAKETSSPKKKLCC